MLGLKTLRLNQDRVFLDGIDFPQSKDKMDLFQEHSALENIKIILSLDLPKMYSIQESIFLGVAVRSFAVHRRSTPQQRRLKTVRVNLQAFGVTQNRSTNNVASMTSDSFGDD